MTEGWNSIPDPLDVLASPRTGDDQAEPRARYGDIDTNGPLAAEPDWSYYPRAIYRRRWTAITVLFLALLTGVMRNLKAVPVYEAVVRVLVEPERVNLVKIDDPVSNGTSSDANIAILRSRWLVRKTLESLERWPAAAPVSASAAAAVTPPPSPPPVQPGSTLTVEGVLSSARNAVQNALGFSPPAGMPRTDETLEQTASIDGFLGGLDASLTTTGLLDITYRSSNPVEAAKFANAHAQQYMGQTLERRFEAVKEVTDWLSVRLADQRQKLDGSEVALARFREDNHLSAVGAENQAVLRLNALSVDLTKARTTRLEKEALLNRAQALRSDTAALDRIGPMAASGTIQQLKAEIERLQRDRAQLGQSLREKHPDMIKLQNAIQTAQQRLDDERARILSAMRDEVTSAQTLETALSAQLNSEKSDATSQNKQGLQLSILMREVESNRQIYDMLVQRARDADIAKDINPSRNRILDPARVPQSPISPNKRRDLMVSFAMGLTLAILLPLGFEFLDNRIKSPEQLLASLGLPFLGLLPEVHPKRWSRRQAAPLLSNGVTQQFLECVRQLRTNIVFSFTEGSSRSMVITSSGPAEGKTVVASNVAIALAQLGHRVLLIDGDMRRPKVHEFFGLACEPGLSNLLVGDAKASEVVQKSGVQDVWVLPAGHRPPNPCDLLGSESFKRFLAAARDHFDWVLIDAPPALAVTDACIVAHMTTGVLFVVGAERVTRPAARRAIAQLESVQAKFVGAVLSRVDLDGHAYYYSHYYRHKYTDYYADQPSSKSGATPAA